jgi:hypothetical protein
MAEGAKRMEDYPPMGEEAQKKLLDYLSQFGLLSNLLTIWT